ncbi:MAG: rod shape-determining protein MreC [Planctomycetaceae bacterium]|nr:rod shape-determining protein MreC [Planctomycetaceae bacterium]
MPILRVDNMRRSGLFSWLITTLALSALSLGLLSLPDDFSQPIRLAGRDLSRPGQTVTRAGVEVCQASWRAVRDWQARRVLLDQLEARLAAQVLREREFKARVADLTRRLHQAETQAAAKIAGIPTEPLLLPEWLEARVLSSETVTLMSGRKVPGSRLLGTGKVQGVGENLLVLDQGRAILDIGADHGVAIHQPVFAGEIVIGRTANCGSYTCSLQPVTDAKFQSPAQLLRKTSSGWQTGAVGVIEGTGGERCRLTGIGAKEAVEVGDEVYSPAADPLMTGRPADGDSSNRIPPPMFYGKIVRAKWERGATYWEIEVEPAAKTVRPTFVWVLKPKENAVRVLAN